MQRFLAAPELILCLLAVFDVSRRTIPTRWPSALIEQRVVADLEPAVFAIPPKHALFVLKGNAIDEGFVSLFSEPLHIFRMERACPKIAGPHFVERQPSILEHLLIHEDCRSASVQYDDVVRYQINDPLQLVFALRDLELTCIGHCPRPSWRNQSEARRASPLMHLSKSSLQIWIRSEASESMPRCTGR